VSFRREKQREPSGWYTRMNDTNHEPKEDEMKSEYDFTGGVRGKHAAAFHAGHSVRITHPDGSVTEEHFPPAEGIVTLEEDVREFFPDSESVNKALRSLIELIPKKRKSA